MKYFRMKENYFEQLKGNPLIITLNHDVADAIPEDRISKANKKFTVFIISFVYNGEIVLNDGNYGLKKGDSVDEYSLGYVDYEKLSEFKAGESIAIDYIKSGEYINIKSVKKVTVEEATQPKKVNNYNKSTNDSIESQVQLKEVAPILKVALEAGHNILEEPLPDLYLGNVHNIFMSLKNTMNNVSETSIDNGIEESKTPSKSERESDDVAEMHTQEVEEDKTLFDNPPF